MYHLLEYYSWHYLPAFIFREDHAAAGLARRAAVTTAVAVNFMMASFVLSDWLGCR